MRTIDDGDEDDRIALALANDFIKVIQERVERSLQDSKPLREAVPVLHSLAIVVANAIALYARDKASREVSIYEFVAAVRHQMPAAVKNVRETDKRLKKPH